MENNVCCEVTIDYISSYFRKISFLKGEQAKIKEQAEREISRINKWLEEEMEPLEGKINYFEGEILRFYAREKAINPKVRISTPYGKVSTRKATKWIYEDEQALINYCKENNIDCIRTKEELDKTIFKKVCKNGVNQETGEVIPSLRIEETESIVLKVAE